MIVKQDLNIQEYSFYSNEFFKLLISFRYSNNISIINNVFNRLIRL